MKKRKSLVTAAAALAIAAAAYPAMTADHLDAPALSAGSSADIGDIYAFRNQIDPSKLVLIMTVNPLSEPSLGTSYNFSPDVLYEFMIDNNADAIADHVFEFRFTPPGPGMQSFRASLPGVFALAGLVTPPSLEPDPEPPIIAQGPNGILAFAGSPDDPFFFDAVGFARFLAGTGTFSGEDSFAGSNVSALVLEVPIVQVVGQPDVPLQIWAATSRRQVTLRRSDVGQLPVDFGGFQQLERMGNPLASTALIPFGQKGFFNIGLPMNDETDFMVAVTQTLMDLGTNADNIDALTKIFIPDVIKLNLLEPDGFPNGRRLEDDVIDTILAFMFNQSGVSDRVDANDKPFRSAFPYLAAPHQPQ